MIKGSGFYGLVWTARPGFGRFEPGLSAGSDRIEADSSIVLAMLATVLVSILAHGISAKPAIKLYARKIAELGPEAPEYVKCLP